MTWQERLAETSLPYGIHDLDPRVVCYQQPEKRVRCYVRGCRHVLRVPGRGRQGEVCPEHGIRCHYSGKATYAYRDSQRNIIASPDLFARRILRHPFKYESHRLGGENSEDALSWNVFRNLQEAGRLGELARTVTGEELPLEPFLYLWGIGLDEDRCQPWPLLQQARRHFEARLPVDRPLTEPDIALHLPGRYLILIEAKFTSGNTSYVPGPRKDQSSLTFAELLRIYDDPNLQMPDREKARQAGRIFHQLWRNTVFAEWMAARDHPRTQAYHVNLVCEGKDESTAAEFRQLLAPDYRHRFQRWTWEGIYRLLCHRPELQRLQFGVGPGGTLRIPVRVDFSVPFPAADQQAWQGEYEHNVRLDTGGVFSAPAWSFEEFAIGDPESAIAEEPNPDYAANRE